ncbi:heterokaryon incompatibility protein-domain-containing protein [Xylaria palmicola]|nr:heterokaryon incompatibility protein-domain-containing protein [Xylaria palmicola]
MAQPVYRHEPLTSPTAIRVLDLLPSLSRAAPIRCRVRQVELGPDAGYEALSYVWGDRQGSCPITCDGRRLLVTPNCLAALTRFRYPLRTRTLWIDAICIDQGTHAAATAERNRQVAMMGDVYRSACAVIVWLAPGDHDALVPDIFRYLTILGYFRRLDLTDVPRVVRRAGRRARPWVVKAAWPGGPGASRMKGPALASLLELLGNEWFSRVWTMREIITPGRCTVTCGASTVDWDHFFVGMRDAGASYHSSANAMLVYLRGILAGEILDPPDADDDDDYRRMHDIQLLKAMCSLRCAVPHDKIYGLYSIFGARGLRLPDPDYDRPLVHILEETARAYVQHQRKLDILRITLPPGQASGLPSWVPDWLSGQSVGQLRCSDATGTVTVCFSDFPSTISSCRGAFTPAIDTAPPTSGKLTATGSCIGAVSTVSAGEYIGARPVNEPSYFQDFVPICREWCRMMLSTTSYPTGEDPVLAGLRTITSHKGFFPGGKPLDAQQLLLWFDTLLGEDGISHNGCMPQTTRAEKTADRSHAAETPDNVRLVQTVQEYVNYKANYAFIALDSGYFGSAFRTCRRGDRVYLLAGLDVPCVLRPCGDGFKFVALAYVHGAMRGQLWPENEDELENITLV